MADDSKSEDLVAQGLVGFSYDHLFSIRRRIRKMGDFVIPLRGGVTYAQMGTAIVTFFAMIVIYVVIVTPLTAAAGLSSKMRLFIMLATLFGPPVLVAQRMVAPMPDSKTLGGYIRSLTRFYFDDKTYRRGCPIPPPTTHRKGVQRHDWVVWEPGVEFTQELGDDLMTTRVEIERSFTGQVTDLASAQQDVSRRLIEEERAEAEREEAAKAARGPYDLRHSDAAGVTGL